MHGWWAGASVEQEFKFTVTPLHHSILRSTVLLRSMVQRYGNDTMAVKCTVATEIFFCIEGLHSTHTFSNRSCSFFVVVIFF